MPTLAVGLCLPFDHGGNLRRNVGLLRGGIRLQNSELCGPRLLLFALTSYSLYNKLYLH